MSGISSGAPSAGAGSELGEAPATATPGTGASASPGQSAAVAAPAGEPATASTEQAAAQHPLRESVVQAIKTCYDPEIPVDIYELGLIYDVAIDAANAVQVRMTLTSPMCPVAESLPGEVKDKIAKVPGVSDVDLELVWEPAWDPSLMSEAARLQLGF